MAGQRANQSNPFSTGGGGVNFEVYVQTYIAMHIVTGDSLPFLNSSKPVKMKLQGHYAGYDTDDCIVFGEKDEKVLCQIKHSITVSEKDPVFRAVITDAWNDYCNRDAYTAAKTEFICKWTSKALKLKEELQPPASQR